ncbi:MAG: 4-hydroxybenzoate octaprenyltransferase [Alphaproteobacteria bacterium]|nr:4-hydroxybenzoate octaprenyltransferase [Alphaproteobacteria bacterium]
MREKLPNYLKLMRMEKPQGSLLLFFPCVFGYTLAGDFNLKISVLFLICSILMRGTGCIINDIADRDFDKHVKRTKDRPITSGKVSVREAIILAISISISILSLLIALQFLPFESLIIAISSIILVIIYPFCKRFTYFPQAILGLTFNIGALVGWRVIEPLNTTAILLYIGLIFWTLGYDTIYALSDAQDDKTIGIKSTALYFKEKTPLFVSSCYTVFSLILFIIGYLENLSLYYHIFMLLASSHMLMQILKVSKGNYNAIFRSNILTGMIIWLGFIVK